MLSASIKKPKILYVITQSEWGGAQRYIFDLAQGLKNDFDISIAAGQQCRQGRLCAKAEGAGLAFYPLTRLKRAVRPWSDLLAIWELRRLIRSVRPDIIHLNSTKVSVIGSLAVLGLRPAPKVVYTAHGWVFNEPLSRQQKRLYWYAEKLSALAKDVLICLNQADCRTAADICPRLPAKLIYNGINARTQDLAALSRLEARLELGIDPGDFVVGANGNLYATKGYEHLIDAAVQLKKDMPGQMRFVVIGEGPDRGRLEALLAKKGLSSQEFSLLGAIDDSSRYLKAFDIYACSSVKEGFPYAILEAMAAGLPIATTQAGGIVDAIEHNKDGLLSPVGNGSALADNIMLLHLDEPLRRSLSDSASLKVRADFSLEQMLAKTSQTYLTK